MYRIDTATSEKEILLAASLSSVISLLLVFDSSTWWRGCNFDPHWLCSPVPQSSASVILTSDSQKKQKNSSLLHIHTGFDIFQKLLWTVYPASSIFISTIISIINWELARSDTVFVANTATLFPWQHAANLPRSTTTRSTSVAYTSTFFWRQRRYASQRRFFLLWKWPC